MLFILDWVTNVLQNILSRSSFDMVLWQKYHGNNNLYDDSEPIAMTGATLIYTISNKLGREYVL